MRRGDRKILEGYNEIAKEALLDNPEGAELERLVQVLDWNVERAAEKQETPKETQVEVFKIQAEKQEIMQELRAQLRCIDDPECEPSVKEDARAVIEQDGKYFATQEDGSAQEVSLGDIFTDGEWGVEYRLDETLPRSVRKHYLTAEARRSIFGLLNQQLARIGSESKQVIHQRQESFASFRHKEGEVEETPGHRAEKIVGSMMEKFAIDLELPFRIHQTDAWEDVEHKIDFVVSRKKRRRGVRVEEDEHIDGVGIQLTTGHDVLNTASQRRYAEKQHSMKEKQLRKARELIGSEIFDVEDIVLLLIGNKAPKSAYNAWLASGRASGGPESFLRNEIQEEIFRGILHNVFEEEEIDSMWKDVNGTRDTSA